MDQTVYIPFCHKLDPGDSSFYINVSRSFLENPERLFSFQAVTLYPDYYSRQAFKLNMDSDAELNAIVANNFNLEIKYDKLFYHNVEETKAWGPTLNNVNISAVLKSLNSYFETNKPAGLIFPAVVFDWLHISSLSKKDKVKEFYQSIAMDLYGEEYNASKHLGWLPNVYREKTKLNDFIFPTTTNQEVLDLIRIRMTLSPSVIIAFSNIDLPKVLGFSDVQIADKKNRQYQFQNENVNSLVPIVCHNVPTAQITSVTTKVHVYPQKPIIVSPRGIFKTTKARERTPKFMAQDYSAILADLASTMNLIMSIELDENEKKFKIVYPAAKGITINLRVSNYVGHQLGYGHVDLITQKTTNKSYPEEIATGEDVEKLSRTLVMDTGDVIVTLGERGSQQMQQFSNPYMATLQPNYMGVLTTGLCLDLPKIQVTYFNPKLEFLLSRFNENNEPTPLDWKIGAYVRGTLIGKV